MEATADSDDALDIHLPAIFAIQTV